MSALHKIKKWDTYNGSPLVDSGAECDTGFQVIPTGKDYIDFERTRSFQEAFPFGEIYLAKNSFSQTRETDII